jgi:hypothetical protein
MLLKIMAQDNTRAFELFLPAIVQFTLQCAPVMQRINESEAIVQIAASFYGLIHAILIQNMKYFFPRSDGEDPRLQELTGLLTAMIAAFQSTNLEICKVNLDAIGELSTKTRLFHQPYFLATTRAPFSITLLCILAEKSHDSLRDDFITALYRLAVVDIYGFYSDLLVNFINEKSAIDDRARQSVLQQLSAVEVCFYNFFSRYLGN